MSKPYWLNGCYQPPDDVAITEGAFNALLLLNF